MRKEEIRQEADTIAEIMEDFQGDDRMISAAPIYEIQDEKMKEKGLFLLVSWELAEDTDEKENHLFFDLRDECNSHHTAVLPESVLEKDGNEKIYKILDHLFSQVEIEEKKGNQTIMSGSYLAYISYSFDESYMTVPFETWDEAKEYIQNDIEKERHYVEAEAGYDPAVLKISDNHFILVYDEDGRDYKTKEYIEYRILEVGRGMPKKGEHFES